MIPKISNKDLYEHCHRTEDEEQTEQEEQVELHIIPNMVPSETFIVGSIATPKKLSSPIIPFSGSIPELNTSDTDMESQRTTEENEKTSLWMIILFVLAAIGYVIFSVFFFIPLFILALFGISKHPFMGYIIFRDLMRKR